ncbi:Two-component sensor PilS [Dissulfuribacter thermophilus]|uniref:histidine kinase n=1 Tax=Dissulfuribacter thermophilus TaxID=1156395 RepID=A0A1B9F8W6_9BACT|nr:ATP-binding protein [Dissulfuribacter thermophilus]OCC16359.1 Two-component sensor PilS [Dissulfuribacter thermophilus]
MASYNISPRLFHALTGGRLLILLILLIGTLFFEGFGHELPTGSIYKFSLLLAFAFSVTAIVTIWYKKKRLSLPFVYAYIFTDLLIVAGVVYLTGGTQSPLTFLFMLVILSSCFFEYHLGPNISAIAATIIFILLGAIDAKRLMAPDVLAFTFFTNMAAFWLAALLGSILAKRLLASREEVDRLKAIQDTVLDSLSSGLILIDADGTIIFVNKAALNILNGVIKVQVGMKLRSNWHELWRLKEDAEKDGYLTRYELTLSTQHGEKKIIGMSIFPLLRHNSMEGDEGQYLDTLGYGFIFQDITQLKEQEQRLQRMDRLAALGQMAAGLAHELRNPLASMSGAAQFLAKKGHMDENSKRLLEIIQREAERLDSIAESFLLYARPERVSNEADSDIVVVIEEVLSLLERKKGLPEVIVETEFKVKQRVAVPQGALKQVVLNLLMNAYEAMGEDGGRIRISARHRQDRDDVELIIEDSGSGIEEKDLQRIFDPFYSTKPKGTGLGLAIVHSLVTSWGGEIDVWSQKGEGTRFTITLPMSASLVVL